RSGSHVRRRDVGARHDRVTVILCAPLLDESELIFIPVWRAVGTAVLVVVVAACDLPFQLGQPTTRELETGATDSLSNTASFTLRGTYADAAGSQWTINALLQRPDREDVGVTGPGGQVEAILIGSQAYF